MPDSARSTWQGELERSLTDGCPSRLALCGSHPATYRFTMRPFARRLVVASTLTFVASLAPRARAEDWYGGQTLAFDGTALGFLAAGVATKGAPRKVFLGLSLGTYLVASPVIHGVHERGGAAVGAVFLRLGAPLALGVLGLGIGAAHGEGFEGVGIALVAGIAGMALGALAAAGIDAAVLAREADKPLARGASALSRGPVFFLPWGAAF